MVKTVVLVSFAAGAVWAQAPPAPAKPKPGPSTAYQQAARIPARIMEFRAEPASIQPGGSATIVWASENPQTAVISGLGEVTARGSRRVTPAATTTYTFTVRGPNGEETRELTVTVAGTEAVTAAAVVAEPRPTPRMPDGRPNLSGIYNSSSFNFAGRSVRGQNDPIRATLKPGAEEFRIVRGPNDAGGTADCMPTGVPRAYFLPYQWQIVQGLDRVVILYEYPHVFRVVEIGGAHPAEPDPTWMGHAVGRWEGDTLVIDSAGFNDKTELPGGYRHTEALHVVERFTRVDYDNLEWEAVIEDQNVFAEPWKLSRGFPLRPDLSTLGEFICENNRDYSEFFEKQQ